MKRYKSIYESLEEGYFISPIGKIISLPSNKRHIKYILSNLSLFGFTKNDIEDIKNDEINLGSEDIIEDVIMNTLIKRGWVRVRGYDSYFIEIYKLTPKIKKYLYNFSKYMMKIKKDVKKVNINIGAIRKNIITSFNDIVNESLLNEKKIKKMERYKSIYKEEKNNELNRFWISPIGKIIPLPEGDSPFISPKYVNRPYQHTDYVLENPKLFGYTIDKLERMYKKNNEIFADYVITAGDIYDEVLKLNWIRISEYKKDGTWFINFNKLTPRVKNNIYKFAKFIIDKDIQQKYKLVKLVAETGIRKVISTTFQDILNESLLNEAIKYNKNTFLKDIKNLQDRFIAAPSDGKLYSDEEEKVVNDLFELQKQKLNIEGGADLNWAHKMLSDWNKIKKINMKRKIK